MTSELACPSRVGWKDVIAPRPYPREFRDDVVRVARCREDGVTIEQVAADFGVHPMTRSKWLRQADVDDGATSGKTTGESAELRELRRRNRLLEQENEVLRRAAAYLSQSNLPGRRYPLVKELAAEGIPVAVPCQVLKLARQPYYRWLANPVTDAELAEAYRANALFDAHRDDPEFGYRFLVAEAGDAGQPMAERTAWRICSNNGWWSAFGKRKRGKNGKAGPPVHDDLVAAISPPMRQISCGWLTLLNTAPARASSTSARSKTCSPTASSATPSTRG